MADTLVQRDQTIKTIAQIRAGDVKGKWTCGACTFEHTPEEFQLLHCRVCESPRVPAAAGGQMIGSMPQFPLSPWPQTWPAAATPPSPRSPAGETPAQRHGALVAGGGGGGRGGSADGADAAAASPLHDRSTVPASSRIAAQRCTAGCGLFGSPETEGMCSQCHRVGAVELAFRREVTNMKAIVSGKERGGQMMYKVRYKGRTKDDDEWVAADGVTPELIAVFRKRKDEAAAKKAAGRALSVHPEFGDPRHDPTARAESVTAALSAGGSMERAFSQAFAAGNVGSTLIEGGMIPPTTARTNFETEGGIPFICLQECSRDEVFLGSLEHARIRSRLVQTLYRRADSRGLRVRGEATALSFHCLSLCFSAFPCGSTALTEDRCNQLGSVFTAGFRIVGTHDPVDFLAVSGVRIGFDTFDKPIGNGVFQEGALDIQKRQPILHFTFTFPRGALSGTAFLDTSSPCVLPPNWCPGLASWGTQ
eukprot:SAG22_NODE_2712_length_2290_cov_2.544044_1_plen_478_part_00